MFHLFGGKIPSNARIIGAVREINGVVTYTSQGGPFCRGMLCFFKFPWANYHSLSTYVAKLQVETLKFGQQVYLVNVL